MAPTRDGDVGNHLPTPMGPNVVLGKSGTYPTEWFGISPQPSLLPLQEDVAFVADFRSATYLSQTQAQTLHVPGYGTPAFVGSANLSLEYSHSLPLYGNTPGIVDGPLEMPTQMHSGGPTTLDGFSMIDLTGSQSLGTTGSSMHCHITDCSFSTGSGSADDLSTTLLASEVDTQPHMDSKFSALIGSMNDATNPIELSQFITPIPNFSETYSPLTETLPILEPNKQPHLTQQNLSNNESLETPLTNASESSKVDWVSYLLVLPMPKP
jgi:hypothetical protein